MKLRWIFAVFLSASTMATVSFAHLPSPNDARFAIDRERMRMTQEMNRGARNTRTFANRGQWNPMTEYGGDYTTFSGDTVEWKNEYGQTLLWWAKFWSRGDEPGGLGAGGGTSPWVLINSRSGGKNYQWSGWGSQRNGNQSTSGLPRIATWRYGAEGAYSFTHDDIGAMPFHTSIKPAYDLGKEPGFEEIRTGWGVFVGQMDEDEWKWAIAMVRDGHEMFNHSMDHTSAANQFQWFYNGQTIPDFDPSIPYAIRGLTVRSLFVNPTFDAPWETCGTWGGFTPGPNANTNLVGCPSVTPTRQLIRACAPNDRYASDNVRWLRVQDQGIRIEGPAYWTGLSFSADACILRNDPIQITPLGSTRRIVLPSGQGYPNGQEPVGSVVYVQYTREHNFVGSPADGSDMTVNHTGILYATTPAWHELFMLNDYFGGSTGWNSTTRYTGAGFDGDGVVADQGVAQLIASVFTVGAWGPAERTKNMRDANNVINEKIYSRIINPGRHFAVGKVSDYYGYPFDAYSLETHAALKNYGILQARGGSKTPQVMKGDFFHPYAIDFDAFWIDRTDWTPASQGPDFTYPGNAHVWLGLNEMVDSIVHNKGYMIREFHSVADIADGAWFNSGASNTWPLNSSAHGVGGWWGGITKDQLRVHYQHLKTYIDANRLVVYTPAEAVKYRLTANYASNPRVTSNILTVDFDMNGFRQVYQAHADMNQFEEITVIVGMPAGTTQLNVEYVNPPTVKAANGTDVVLNNPRLRPRSLGTGDSQVLDAGNGSVWAVQFNPTVAGGVRLIPGQPFVEPEWDGPDYEIPDVDNKEPCFPGSPNWPHCAQTSVSKPMARVDRDFAFTGIQNGQINLRLTSGNYTAQLYNVQGRMVGSADISAVNGVNATGLRTDHLARGVFILQVRNAQGAQVLRHRLVINR